MSRSITAFNSKIYLSNLGKFNSWRCYDALDYREKKTIVEVFNFYNFDIKNTGIILFDGGNSGKVTTYQRNGINHRWNFDLDSDDSYIYSFVIKSNGNALYYDFSSKPKNSSGGKTASPSQSFKCRKS